MEWQDSGPARPRHSDPGRTLFAGRLVAQIIAENGKVAQTRLPRTGSQIGVAGLESSSASDLWACVDVRVVMSMTCAPPCRRSGRPPLSGPGL